MKNTVNKSDESVKKQQDAKGNAASLKQQVAAQESYIASLKAQISQANANAQAQAAAEAARQQQTAQKKLRKHSKRQSRKHIMMLFPNIRKKHFLLIRIS